MKFDPIAGSRTHTNMRRLSWLWIGSLLVPLTGCEQLLEILENLDQQSCEDMGMASCDGLCVDVYSSDTANCGACGLACGDGEICEYGYCTTCDGATACPGRCADLQWDYENCGGCGIVCGGESNSCENGTCVCLGGTVCDGACTDTQYDTYHCGACGSACDEMAGESCVSGSCVTYCDDGGMGYGGYRCEADGPCLDIYSDPANCGGCGVACGDGEICEWGACTNCQDRETWRNDGTSTTIDLTPCPGLCADLTNDPGNCGGCGIACGGETNTCQDGACVCAGTVCNGACTDTSYDSYNCGACGTTCDEAGGELCNNGSCVTYCEDDPMGWGGYRCEPDGPCVEIYSDRANCGGCGIACGDGEVCDWGTCSDCGGPENQCGGFCTDVAWDWSNCGACGNACEGAESCDESRCVCPIDAVQCDGVCTATAWDSANCGACGNVCTDMGSCDNGTCVLWSYYDGTVR